MRQAFRASLLHCLSDPGEESRASAFQYFEDGLLIIEDGIVLEAGNAENLLEGLAEDVLLVDYPGKLIVPGFIDCHVHYPQLDIIASYGEQLLDWLNRYAYPAEARFSDPDYARQAAAVFVDELLNNGTTTAMVFGTVHAHSADAIFEAAAARDMRLIAGKVLMDRNCPDELRDDADSAYADSKMLIERWHGQGRLGYAITPRFALTSSEAQLAAAGKLAREYPGVWVHTHLAENRDEVDQIARQFPSSRSYLDVYDHFGLLRERSVFAHCLHLDDQDRARMASTGGAAAFCPTSNLFLGSGLFDLPAMRAAGVRCGLGTDVGGGTSLSMLKTASEAYKVLHLQDHTLPAARALYLATLGAAEALYLDDVIGNFVSGKEADFVVLDPAASSLAARRSSTAETIEEAFFALLTLGDERHVAATFIKGISQKNN
ncbi:MAG: guanine deaminase [Gammaproteobacteria bacterium]|nr:guanine deaminase [Gammaproteobacteria bacterium]MBT8111756.1 guanine deaminase [Gammaproteobacteria bacterium]NND47154.1 guanine deaminase [Woeseiaceae bacterium]NNL46455.1 guanine deaminase [Woeseiaceae bacterium]